VAGFIPAGKGLNVESSIQGGLQAFDVDQFLLDLTERSRPAAALVSKCLKNRSMASKKMGFQDNAS